MQRSKDMIETRERRTSRKRAVLGVIAATVLLAPAASHAQSDVAPPLPNVLILLDTSGSMERLPNANLPSVGVGSLSTSERTRWIQALEVLGGGIADYSMLNVQRTSSDFASEYGLGGTNPYDYGYFLSHYRPLSGGCTIGASSLSATKSWPLDWNTWGVSDFGFRRISGTTLGAVGSCGPADFKTDGLGILDTFRDQARFGLMTFDTATDPNSGYDGTHLPVAGMTGQWSYFPGWDGKGTYDPTYGWPAGCSIDPTTLSTHLFELGARNPSAPPWEGPLVPFASNDTTTALRAVNDRIRYAMLAARPFGATPLAPMLADAQYYYWDDPNGPKADSFASCRGDFIILITDGFPNSDLRPNCEDSTDPKTATTYPACDKVTGGKGCCPTKRPQDITYDLANPPAGSKKPAVKTFVVGFALSDESGAAVDCSVIDPSKGDCSSSTLDPKYKPCCTLHEMAYNGGTGRALLASDTSSLRAALVKAMSDATKTTTTSRTLPVFTGASSSGLGNSQYEFHSSFKVNAFSAWSGVLERIRWQCSTASGTYRSDPVAMDKSAGDDFATDLVKQGTARNFYTYDPTPDSWRSGDSLRPNVATVEDGLPSGAPAVTSGTGSTFVANVATAALELTTSSCTDAASIDECKAKFLNYALGLPQPKTTFYDRVSIPLGDIYHATPVQVGPPGDFLRDESYTLFRNSKATRTPFMLTATNDGLLHAFKTNVTSDTDPVELWAFVPPAVLPHLSKQYGGAHALLLDAAPVVKDVAFGATGSSTPWGRTRNDARGGNATWKTVAVGALTTGRGYYALDVTDPGKPVMLWQLTKFKDSLGEADLFGTYPGVPAIGTVYYKDTTATQPIETPVAFLPGGEGTQFKTGTCSRWKSPPVTGDTYTTARDKVRCWTGPGNSFTVVRLWDGKILRRFSTDPAGDSVSGRPAESNSAQVKFVNASMSDLVKDGTPGKTSSGWTPIDAPLTGAVALYPAATGSVTTRAFVGDIDGDLWKVDVSDTDPKNWRFELFHDAYFPGASENTDWTKWGPVAIPPVLSVDRFGDIVVDYATGDQNNFSASNLNHAYSITEHISVDSLGAKVVKPALNWHLRFPGGITPTGPMSLFSGTLFFSTFTPDTASSDACLRGEGTIWGVDYLDTEPSVTNPDGSPVAAGRHLTYSGDPYIALSCPAATGYANKDARTAFASYYRCMPLGGGTIVFGAGVTQRPSCVSTPTSAIGVDPYLGSSATHSTITDISIGDFQLVAQTGPSTGSGSGSSGSATATITRKLTAPLSSTRIDSWAAIIE